MSSKLLLVPMTMMALVTAACGGSPSNGGGGGGGGGGQAQPALSDQVNQTKCKAPFTMNADSESHLVSIQDLLRQPGKFYAVQTQAFVYEELKSSDDGSVTRGSVQIDGKVSVEADGSTHHDVTLTCEDRPSELNMRATTGSAYDIDATSGYPDHVVMAQYEDGSVRGLYQEVQAANRESLKTMGAQFAKDEDGAHIEMKAFLRSDGRYELRSVMTKQENGNTLYMISRAIYFFSGSSIPPQPQPQNPVPAPAQPQPQPSVPSNEPPADLAFHKGAFDYARSELYLSINDAEAWAGKMGAKPNPRATLELFKKAFAYGRETLYKSITDAEIFGQLIIRQSNPLARFLGYQEYFKFARETLYKSITDADQYARESVGIN